MWPSILRWVAFKWLKEESVLTVTQQLFSLAANGSHYVAVDSGRCCLEVIDTLLVIPISEKELASLGVSRSPPTPRQGPFNRAQATVLPTRTASDFFEAVSWERLLLHVVAAVEILSGRPVECRAGLVAAPISSSCTRYFHTTGRGSCVCRQLVQHLQRYGSACAALAASGDGVAGDEDGGKHGASVAQAHADAREAGAV